MTITTTTTLPQHHGAKLDEIQRLGVRLRLLEHVKHLRPSVLLPHTTEQNCVCEIIRQTS